MSESGKNKLERNVLYNWAAQFIQVISGFIIPRLIGDSLGQIQLGIWDFAWSIVSYLSLAQFGTTATVNRFVARYQSTGDQRGLNRTASSALAILTGGAVIVITITLALFFTLDKFFSDKLGDDLITAQWIVLILGTKVAIATSLSAFGGILTGHHRWDVFNGIHIGSNILSLASMYTILTQGYGIIALSIAYSVATILGVFIRVAVSLKMYPDIKYKLEFVHLTTIKEIWRFGRRSFIPTIGKLISNQGLNILILAKLGPAALAVYARPRSLVRHLNSFIARYSIVLIPTISSLHSQGQMNEVRKLAIRAASIGSYIAFPIIIILSIFGGEIIYVWMGEEYRNDILITSLSLAYALQIIQLPLSKILAGLNEHSLIGTLSFCGSIATLFASYICLTYFNLGILSITACIAFPTLLIYGLFLPLHVCRKLELDYGTFLAKIWIRPIIANLPIIICLLASKHAIGPRWYSPFAEIIVGTGVQSATYWFFVISEETKIIFLKKLRLSS